VVCNTSILAFLQLNLKRCDGLIIFILENKKFMRNSGGKVSWKLDTLEYQTKLKVLSGLSILILLIWV
jgi:hypothetical protein